MMTPNPANSITSCIAAFVALAVPAAAQPAITNLGVLPNTSSSEARDVSADGAVVVGTCSGANGNRAFRWTAATSIQFLPRLPGGVEAECYAISQDGLYAVGSSTSSLGNHAVRWPSSGGVEDLGTLYGGISEATAVSADGATVVGNASGQGSGQRAFRWTSTQGMHAFPRGDYDYATAVSDDGAVAAGYILDIGYWVAVRWFPSGFQVIGGGWQNPYSAYGISADGSAVCGEGFVSTSDREPFLWTTSTGMHLLGLPPGAHESSADAMNADGSILVGSCDIPPYGWIWTASLRTRFLQDYLQDFGVDLTGWSNLHPTAINPNGSAIVGYGSFSNQDRAFLVSGLPRPPCPTDLDADGSTGLPDLAILLAHFGTPGGATQADGDLDGDADVDLSDLTLLLSAFGTECP